MNRRPSYLDRLRSVADRYEAADLIRALAAQQVGKMLLVCYTDAELLQIVREAERQAEQLERDWSNDGCSDPTEPPWRMWLRQWGYV